MARGFTSNLTTPAFLVDDAGNLIFFNEAAGHLLGVRFEEAGMMGPMEWGARFSPSAADGRPLPFERNERRRKLLSVLVGRIAAKAASRRARQDAVDVIFALTSHAMFATLRPGRSAAEVCRLVQSACRAALEPLLPDP